MQRLILSLLLCLGLTSSAFAVDLVSFTNNPSATDHIYVMNINGTGLEQITNSTGELLAAWNPAGTMFAYSDGTHLWTVTAQGGSATQITTPTNGQGDTSPAWSADGNTIAFARVCPQSAACNTGSNPNFSYIETVAATGGTVTAQIGNSSNLFFAPKYQPGSNSLISFESNAYTTPTGPFQVYTCTIGSCVGTATMLSNTGTVQQDADPHWGSPSYLLTTGCESPCGTTGAVNVWKLTYPGGVMSKVTTFTCPQEAGDPTVNVEQTTIAYEWDQQAQSGHPTWCNGENGAGTAFVYTSTLAGANPTSTSQQCALTGCSPRFNPRIPPANPASQAKGLYYLYNTGGATAVPSPYPTNFAGYTYRAKWETIEPGPCSATAGNNPTDPTDPCYNWTAYDAVLNAVPSNIKIAIGMIPGVNTPNWALNNYEGDGTGTFASVWNKGFTAGSQSTTTWGSRSIVTGEVYEFPIPWDTNYETDYGNMLQALATHVAEAGYANQIVRFKASPLGEETEENYIMQYGAPYTVGSGSCAGAICKGPCAGKTSGASCTPLQQDYLGTTGCNTSGSGGCGSSGDISWLTAGYTPTKLEGAYQAMLASAVAAFPNIVVDSDFVGGLMPPINNSGQAGVTYSYPSGCTVLSSATTDNCIVYNLINDGFAADPYFAIQQNGTSNSPTTSAKFYLPFSRVNLIGGQEGAALSNNANYATMMSLYAGCTGSVPGGCWNLGYMEIYDADATDPNNVTVDGWANSVMQNPQHQTGQ